MHIGKIIGSNSHTEYLCQIINSGQGTISAEYHALGNFLVAGEEPGEGTISVVMDTRLVDPSYAKYGLRTLPEDDLTLFSPDYLDERMTLVTLFPVGRISGGESIQGMPARSIPLGASVFSLDDDGIREFHTRDGSLRMGYFGDLPRTGGCALAVRRNLVTRLRELLPGQAAALDIIIRSLEWQRLEGGH